jgi:hypothetical protein
MGEREGGKGLDSKGTIPWAYPLICLCILRGTNAKS